MRSLSTVFLILGIVVFVAGIVLYGFFQESEVPYSAIGFFLSQAFIVAMIILKVKAAKLKPKIERQQETLRLYSNFDRVDTINGREVSINKDEKIICSREQAERLRIIGQDGEGDCPICYSKLNNLNYKLVLDIIDCKPVEGGYVVANRYGVTGEVKQAYEYVKDTFVFPATALECPYCKYRYLYGKGETYVYKDVYKESAVEGGGIWLTQDWVLETTYHRYLHTGRLIPEMFDWIESQPDDKEFIEIKE